MHWLIDCENVGVAYKGFVDVGHDAVTLVYSKGYQPKKTSDIVNLTCFESAKGDQSADMAIAALLGGMVIANPDDEYAIVSKDSDFKALCLTMSACGYNVRQVTNCDAELRRKQGIDAFRDVIGRRAANNGHKAATAVNAGQAGTAPSASASPKPVARRGESDRGEQVRAVLLEITGEEPSEVDVLRIASCKDNGSLNSVLAKCVRPDAAFKQAMAVLKYPKKK